MGPSDRPDQRPSGQLHGAIGGQFRLTSGKPYQRPRHGHHHAKRLSFQPTHGPNGHGRRPRPNDEGNIVLSYNIYRSGSFGLISGSPIASIPNPALAPVTTFTDTTATPNTTYYYVVTAVYQSSPANTESPASNHALVTTGAPGKAVPPVTTGTMAFDANVLKPLTGQILNIYYVVPNTGPVEIDIYNITGYPIRYLDPGVAQAGVQASTTWDGTDRNGKLVASGIYLLEIKGTGFHQVKKVAVVK